jgi:hypothetical protein
MSFIRAKEIPPHSGNWYDYEVKTIHEGKHVRQKVIRYLGKSGSNPTPHLIEDTGLRSRPIQRRIRKNKPIQKVDVTLKPIS